jgi:pSer/pThr/pTyr-binding forkhead associated (FHA) protein
MIGAEMPDTSPPRLETPVELKARIEAERSGSAFLILSTADGSRRILTLDPHVDVLTVGRDPSSDVALEWDRETSRLHAQIRRLGAQWTISDDGLSRNGTFVNGQRLIGRRRLRDNDVILCGATRIVFRAPLSDALSETVPAIDARPVPSLSPAQRRVLLALCRPFKDAPQHALPATNREIADELVVTVDAVKANLRALFEKFEVEDLPQHRKRSRLVELALTQGVVGPRDL